MMINLKKLRNDKGLSQQNLADALGLAQQSIYNYETLDIEPNIDTLKRLADFFNVSVDYIIGHTDVRHKIDAYKPYELNEQEAALIDMYRLLPERRRELTAEVIKAFTRID